ncbi:MULTISPECIES: hypothetical protein [Flavobacteriaceae]|uniref:hypothetical protein n=1 Tax=Flavobacteriaceae TaxID=49546 RepID=UPI002349E5B2|nr:hypothetical protein [Muricauda sp. SP22]MDC6361588.1 hypothetical protein [Muricauda sp. SP22]
MLLKSIPTYSKSRLTRASCLVLCLFYLVGLFNGLVIEVLHEASHALDAGTHQHGNEEHHSFFANHQTVDYSSLGAMAGHSHEALEALKDLLEANQPDEKESKDEILFKLDKHFSEETRITSEINTLQVNDRNWAYQGITSFWSLSVITPPPKYY